MFEFNSASFAYVRETLFGGRLAQPQVDGINHIVEAFNRHAPKYKIEKEYLIDELAYVLATVHHETARTMQPIDEYGKGRGKKYRDYCLSGRPHRTGKAYYGRGYPQLTWWDNYKYFSDYLGIDLVGKPHLANDPKISAEILIVGMLEGKFTGYSILDKNDYVEVSDRKAVNGMDRASLIIGYADAYKCALKMDGSQCDEATPTTSKPVAKSKTVVAGGCVAAGGASNINVDDVFVHVSKAQTLIDKLQSVAMWAGGNWQTIALLALGALIIYERRDKLKRFGI